MNDGKTPRNDGTANLHPEVRGTRKLSLREKKSIAEYLATGNKTAAYAASHKVKKQWASQVANQFFKRPKIVDALSKALKESKFDDQYAISTLKKIVDGGMENIDITRPDTSLKALDTYFKITNRMGGGNKDQIKPDVESLDKKMDMSQLAKALKELDKKQKRILAIIGGSEEGEIVHED